jgi:hypothetical protein
MFREGDSLVFQRVTGGIRKPIVRFGLPSGRQVELLAFHLEPAWAFAGESPRPIAREVVRRLYPNERPVFAGEPDQADRPAYLCVAYLYSDTPAGGGPGAVGYSVLLVCGLVENIDRGVRGLVCELLSSIDWEVSATDDILW